MSKFYVSLFVAFLIITQPAGVLAENSTSFPGYTVHHNAFTTDTLTPEIARQYQIQRSKTKGMLNVNVRKEVTGTIGQSVSAQVKAHAANLTGQTRDIPMRQITEGEDIYYIGDFRVANQETLDITIEITPDGEKEPYFAKLRQQFFTQ